MKKMFSENNAGLTYVALNQENVLTSVISNINLISSTMCKQHRAEF